MALQRSAYATYPWPLVVYNLRIIAAMCAAALRLTVASLSIMLLWLGTFPAPLMRLIRMASASL